MGIQELLSSVRITSMYIIKKQLLYIFIIWLFSLFLISCISDTNIEVEYQEDQLVINSLISSDKEISIGITQTSALSDTISKIFNKDEIEIAVYENDVLIDESILQNAFFYNMTNHICKEENTYKLEIYSSFGISTAVDSVPLSVAIDTIVLNSNAFIDEDGFIKSEIKVVFADDGNNENYYEFELFKTSDLVQKDFKKSYLLSTNPIITTEQYYPENSILSNTYPESLPFSDVMFNGDQVEISLIYGPPVIVAFNSNGVLEQWIGSHKVFLNLKSISKSYYLYKTSLLLQLESQRGDLISGMQTPIEVYSNIENGIGIFAASSSWSTDTLLVTK